MTNKECEKESEMQYMGCIYSLPVKTDDLTNVVKVTRIGKTVKADLFYVTSVPAGAINNNGACSLFRVAYDNPVRTVTGEKLVSKFLSQQAEINEICYGGNAMAVKDI